MNKMFAFVRKSRAVVGAALLTGAVSAQAALPTTFATDIAAVKADVTEGGGLVIGVALAVMAVRVVKGLISR